MSQDYDQLELDQNGVSRTVKIRRGSFTVHPGAVSYVQHDDPERAQVYVFSHKLERARVVDSNHA